MAEREPNRQLIKAKLHEATTRDQDARSTWQNIHLHAMNETAEALAANGPLDEIDGMAAFLFAMYGINHQWRQENKQPEQTEVEARVAPFDLGHIEQPFSLNNEHYSNGQPITVYAYARSTHDTHMRRAPTDSEFTAAEYAVSKEYDTYVGRIAVPVVAVDFQDLTLSRENKAVIFEVARRETEDHAGQPKIDAQPQFGTLIAEWKRWRYHTDYYVEELQRVQKATKILRNALD